jgi:hypothetical protein
MTYNYKIGYHSHEESGYVELQHEKKFSDEELTEMISESTVEIIKKMKQDGYVHSFQDIFNYEDHSIIKYLREKYGFKDIGYELSWTVFGWASIFDKSDWEGDRDNHLEKITDAVNKAGFARNDDDYLRMDDEIDKEWKKKCITEDLERLRF